MSSLLLVYVLISCAVAVASSLLAVKVKEDFYAAVLLGFVGLSVASLIALLGFTYVAVFHALVYVGATVLFVIMGVIFIGRGLGYERRMLAAGVLTSVFAGSLFYYALQSSAASGSPAPRVGVDLQQLSQAVLQNQVALVFLVFALALLLVAGLPVARGDAR
ncbi:NADH-quinone oxidoreductase subunit J family protein [Thermofilum pendens]|uniref:Conserved hypothetical NADH-plastoquinone oxidoreductase subunit 6 n=1 Tax=Thermofilum pendens (strain DSM 2475 / Hrk 5) TaxID=368408 RepID=A1RZ53_THEPD|nr:NADH-quinone oxidoreductase subunit J [Thermofilum pendens]ABL78483.1 conserved hypothetical NADH-plastoquinone oxidoreductase subunit 6 [Thermofilum pendens Hrk 5]